MQIQLKIEKRKNKQGEEIKIDNNYDYKQHDAGALSQILSIWDSKKSAGLDDYKLYLGLKDKLEEIWRDDKPEIDLSVDEVKFLKDFLQNTQSKIMQGTQLVEFHIRTIVAIYEQLDEALKEK